MFIKFSLFMMLSLSIAQAQAQVSSNKYYSYEVKTIFIDNKTHSKSDHVDIFCSKLTKKELMEVKEGNDGNAKRFSKEGLTIDDKAANATIKVYMKESPSQQSSCDF